MFAYCNSTVSIFLPTDHTQTPKVCLYTHVQFRLSFYHPFLSMSLFCIYKNIQSIQHSETELVCKGSSPSLLKSSRPSLGNKSKTIDLGCDSFLHDDMANFRDGNGCYMMSLLYIIIIISFVSMYLFPHTKNLGERSPESSQLLLVVTQNPVHTVPSGSKCLQTLYIDKYF